jgi:hypothetical protein
MQDKELYEQILGLESLWSVREVHMDHEAQEIQVHVDHPRGTKSVARSTTPNSYVMTMGKSVDGDTWIRASTRPSW